MSIYGIDRGTPGSESVILSDTSATTIISGSLDQPRALVGLKLVNASGGPLTPVVDVLIDAVAYVLRDNASLADQASEIVTLPGDVYIIPRGADLRVTANANLHVHASYIDTPRNAGRA
jgi:hypothetical protein